MAMVIIPHPAAKDGAGQSGRGTSRSQSQSRACWHDGEPGDSGSSPGDNGSPRSGEGSGDGTRHQTPRAGVASLGGEAPHGPTCSQEAQGEGWRCEASWGHTGRGPSASRASPRPGTQGAELGSEAGQSQNSVSCRQTPRRHLERGRQHQPLSCPGSVHPARLYEACGTRVVQAPAASDSPPSLRRRAGPWPS